MVIEITGNQGLIADQPNVIITFAQEETDGLIDAVLGTLLHRICEGGETEGLE